MLGKQEASSSRIMCTFTSDKALVTHWQFDVLHRFIGSHLLGTPN